MSRRFLLIEAEILPEVFLKVITAKELLASGKAKNVSAATKMAEVSRSAFYKYKDSIFDAQSISDTTTIHAVLLDETGALQALLAGISGAGASVVTLNQSTPEDGTARVSVTVRTGGLHMSLDEMLAKLRLQHTVVDVRRGL